MTNKEQLSMPRCDIEELKGQIEQLKEENKALKQKVVLLEEDVELWRTLYEIEVVK